MEPKHIQVHVEHWLADFDKALTAQDQYGLEGLFTPVSSWRDHGAFTWDFKQFHERAAIVRTLLKSNKEIKACRFSVSVHWPEPRIVPEDGHSTIVIEAFADFETAHGTAVALLNATVDESQPQQKLQVSALYTRLEDLKISKAPEEHPRGNGYLPRHDGQTWKSSHETERRYVGSEPEVLIVGSGQAGLMVAAHLQKLGVNPLIIDKNDRVGDNWYKRYDSLNLHNPVEMNEFPYLSFPKHYPEYLSKDHMGQWLGIYADYLDLNVWASTRFLNAEYDHKANVWSASVQRKDGELRILRPRHIVLATGGIGGKPVIPQLPGISFFEGKVIHSSEYTRISDYGTKKAIVLGSATSAHDIAGDLYEHKAQVTMLQRGPVVVVNMDTANLTYGGYIDPNIPTDVVDIRYGIGLINPIRQSRSKVYHAMAIKRDEDLLARLTAAGLRIGHGVDGMGWLDLFLRTGGGYYFNKGASDIIIKGGIKIEQYSRVTDFVANGAQLDDGEVIEADLIVLATGYQNRKAEVEEQFGQNVAERVGDIATLDDDGEWSNMWGQTGQRGLWFNGGGINQARPGSRRLALLIKADLDGLISRVFRRCPKNEKISDGVNH